MDIQAALLRGAFGRPPYAGKLEVLAGMIG